MLEDVMRVVQNVGANSTFLLPKRSSAQTVFSTSLYSAIESVHLEVMLQDAGY
jgi:hypothetical protein